MRRGRLAVRLIVSALVGALFASMTAVFIGPAYPKTALITALVLFPLFSYAIYWADFVRRPELQRKFRREEHLHHEASHQPAKGIHRVD